MTLPEVLEIKIYESEWDKLSDRKLFIYCRLSKESAFVKATREPESDDEKIKKMPLLFSVREFLGEKEEEDEFRLNTLLTILSTTLSQTWWKELMESDLVGIDLLYTPFLSDDEIDVDDGLGDMTQTGLSAAYVPIDDFGDEFLEQLQDYIRKLVDKIRK